MHRVCIKHVKIIMLLGHPSRGIKQSDVSVELKGEVRTRIYDG